MKPQIILVGGGGHCNSCIDVIEQEGKYQIAGIVDMPEKLHQKILGYEVIATDDELSDIVKTYDYFFITMGQIKSPIKRKTIFKRLKSLKAKLPAIISPLAYVSKHASIGEGTIIMHNALVNTSAKIGKNCIINTNAIIEHDCTVGDYVHISIGAMISGGCIIKNEVFIGAGGVVIQGVGIGKKAIIGAGTLVVKDIPESITYKGIYSK